MLAPEQRSNQSLLLTLLQLVQRRQPRALAAVPVPPPSVKVG